MKICERLIITSWLIAILCSCSGPHQDSLNKNNPAKEKRALKTISFLTVPQLEKYGFLHLNSYNFEILFLGDSKYLLNFQDCNIIGINSSGTVRQYQSVGEGPGEFLRPITCFQTDGKTIGILDVLKKKILLFDLDLNFKKEIRGDERLYRVATFENGKIRIGSGRFDENQVSLLDEKYRLLEPFLVRNKKSSLNVQGSTILNRIYLLDKNRIAHTSWAYLDTDCRVDIIDVNSKQVISTVKWKNEYRRTQKDLDTYKNAYSSQIMSIHDRYYVINNSRVKNLKSPHIAELMIFDQEGNLKYRNRNSPYGLVSVKNSPDDRRIYLFNEEEGLVYIDVNTLLDQ